MRAGRATRQLAGVLALLLLLALPGVALGDEAEPSVITLAWYWESQQNESVTTPVGDIAIELPNPFCPGVAGLGGSGVVGETCVQGRLPVEVVNGDYEEPDKVSAVTFDMSVVPPGSTVSDFTVTFLEAESGCRESGDTQTGQQCEQTNPQNIEGRELQACLVTQIFGDGEARPYDELPKFKCADTDPVAAREEIENDAEADPLDQTPDHIWEFDLTAFAAEWTKEFSVVTSIMLRPKAPEGEPGPTDSWRVVLAGPKYPDGIKTLIKFEPPETTTGPPPGGDGGIDTGIDTGGGDFGSAPGGGFDPGGPTTTGDAPPTDTGEEPIDTGGTEETGAALPEVETMPSYLWLGLLAGLIGFFLVRSVLFERAAGVRPGGVLAQIHHLNASRRGGAAVTPTPGALSVVGTRLAAAGGTVKSAIT
ncbi:MAG: hypothetical protein ABR505_05350, partial [Actinomycetota bacterium]